MKANHNGFDRHGLRGGGCSLQHKDTKNESKSQLFSDCTYLPTCCSLQHKDTKNESKSQHKEVGE